MRPSTFIERRIRRDQPAPCRAFSGPSVADSETFTPPFTLALPYANLFVTDVLVIIIGMVLASAFSATLVYRVCSFLPAIGLLTYFLPDLDQSAAH